MSENRREFAPAAGKAAGAILIYVFQTLYKRYGPQHWWPADTSFEVMVGAILTQSCAWRNVEKAISALKESEALSPGALRAVALPELASLIRPCGYYNAKAKKLKALAEWLKEYADNLKMLSTLDAGELRKGLLSVYGIGEETADSIILYALGKPVFVIDAYTRRIMSRLGLAPRGEGYGGYQRLFMANLPHDAALFGEYHALLVLLAKDACRKSPICAHCCLGYACHFYQSAHSQNGLCFRLKCRMEPVGENLRL